MPPTCRICKHPRKADIDAALVTGQALRNIAEQFGTSPPALLRHRDAHLATDLVAANQAVQEEQAINVLGEMRVLLQRSKDTLARAEATCNWKAAHSALRELRQTLEVIGRLLGDLKDGPTVNVALVTSPEWTTLRTKLLNALASFPEARAAVSAALLEGKALTNGR